MTTEPLDLLAWNCYVANSDREVAAALGDWIERFAPHVITLSEARTHFDAVAEVADKYGYIHQQAHPTPDQGGVVSDVGDSALLISKDVQVIKTQRVKMRLRWRVLSHNKTHTPREYEVATIRVGGRRWKVRASHFPTLGFNGPNRVAFLESATRAKAWGLASGRRTSTVDAGDFNDQKTAFQKFMGRAFKIAGAGIDIILTRRVGNIEHQELGKGGGDHHAQFYRMTPTA